MYVIYDSNPVTCHIIFIAFGENPYVAHYAGDTRFVINRFN